jgi:hypothetical protein
MKNAQVKELEGIRFVVDSSGERVAVLIDLKEHGELWEDFYDTMIANRRASESRQSLDSVRESLKRQGKLSA